MLIYFNPQPKRGGAYNLTCIRTSVQVSVDSNFSEVYGSTILKLYAKTRLGPRIIHVKWIFDIIPKWWPGGHLGCKHICSRTLVNTIWILFKLGAERMFQEGPGKQMATRGAYLLFGSRNNTVLAYISKMVQDRVIVLLFRDRKSYEVSFGTVFFYLVRP